MNSKIVIASLALAVVSAAAHAEDALLKRAQQTFKPLPKFAVSKDNPITPAKVALGRRLFFDPRISLDGTVSCSRCHLPQLYATDGLPKAIGAKARVNPRNAPVIFNSALQIAEHWRGDRKSVEDQAQQALLGPPSFGLPDNAAAVAKLKSIPEYPGMFAKAFPGGKDPVTVVNWGKAIGAYERTLQTPAPFDAYLKGDERALSARAKAGLKTFMDVGCASCHNGVNVGGGMYQKFGVYEDYWKATGSKEIDKGRFDVTKNPADTYVFKVPPLRNVAMTPPYFHDGSVATLPQAVRIMGKVQLNKDLSNAQVDDIVAFLHALTGRIPKNYAPPVLPASAFKE